MSPQIVEQSRAKLLLLRDEILDCRIAGVIGHGRQQPHPAGEESLSVHGNFIRGVEIMGGEALDSMAIKVEPNPLAQMFDAADVIRRTAFRIDGGLNLPI